jgi:hypothetical protein
MVVRVVASIKTKECKHMVQDRVRCSNGSSTSSSSSSTTRAVDG